MKRWLVLGLLLLATISNAQIELGKDYERLPHPVPIGHSKKVEVFEFFYYGCVHCFQLEPVLSKWEQAHAKEVSFKRVHVVWQKSMKNLARLYETEKRVASGDRLHMLIFDAILQKRIDLSQETVLKDWLKKIPGVDVPNFMQTYNSFGVETDVARAAQLTKDYAVSGTPMIVIAGKYKVLPATPDRLVYVMTELLNKAKQEQGIK